MHSAVCELAHGPRPSSKHIAEHKNNRKTDNRPSNLEWITRGENVRRAFKNELLYLQHIHRPNGFILADYVFDSVSQAAKRFRLSPGTIASAASGKSKTAGGYKWVYV